MTALEDKYKSPKSCQTGITNQKPFRIITLKHKCSHLGKFPEFNVLLTAVKWEEIIWDIPLLS